MEFSTPIVKHIHIFFLGIRQNKDLYTIKGFSFKLWTKNCKYSIITNIKQNHLTKNLPNQYRYIFALNLFKTKE